MSSSRPIRVSEWGPVLSAPQLDWETQTDLFRRMRPPHAPAIRDAARETLIEHNTRLAAIMALHVRWKFRKTTIDDLFGYALLGLIEAVDRFDVDRDLAFGSYAGQRILYRLRRWTWLSEQIIAIPNDLKATIYKAKHKKGTPRPNVRDAINTFNLQFLTGNISYTLTNPPGKEHDQAARVDVRIALDELDREKPGAAQVLRLRFGFDDGRPLTFREISQRLTGVTKDQAQRIERDGLAWLAQRLKAHRPERGGTRPPPQPEKPRCECPGCPGSDPQSTERQSMAPFGLEGTCCHACRTLLWKWMKDGVPFSTTNGRVPLLTKVDQLDPSPFFRRDIKLRRTQRVRLPAYKAFLETATT